MPKDWCRCPISVAIQRALQRRVFVFGTSVMIAGEDHALPQAARQFIEDYDNGDAVFSFDFELAIESEAA